MDLQNNLPAYYFHQGTATRAYEYLGCHLESQGSEGYVYAFRVFAPNALSVGLVGAFCGWDTPVRMTRITEAGIYECMFHSDRLLDGEAYKFAIRTQDGRLLYKGDPYGFWSRGGADGASLVFQSEYTWGDAAWLAHRASTITSDRGGNYLATPINIYEMHLPSFVQKEDKSAFTYRELAERIVPYVKAMGYTHIELMPIAEYPYDGSWGYQICGFYAPTSRFGTPDDLRYFVDTCHRSGIGVLIDWVPAHFPKDAWGLFEFDGKPLYEYQGLDRMESPSWGTRYFDLGRTEIQSFLISNALYFLREFHIDGLRVDAVASMLYLDFDRKPGEWIPNADGGRENIEAIAFLKKLNGTVLGEIPDALMIAEESTAFPGVTHPTTLGGLGFSMKWNMGWANDLYDYLSSDPIHRKHRHTALNFPLLYAFSENYVLPISHDEVVHGKRSFIDKMHGSYEEKFNQARAALLLMMTYPGKKMLFMGTEFAQFREWDFENALEWFMLDYPMHRAFREYTRALNHFYLEHSELWQMDFDPRGFSWILADAANENAVAFHRYAEDGAELTVLITFSGVSQTLVVPMEDFSDLALLFSTDPSFSLSASVRINANKKNGTAAVTLPPFSGVILRRVRKTTNLKLTQEI